MSSTSNAWDNGNKIGHHEQHGNGEKSKGRNNLHYPGGHRVQYPQELGNADLVDQQEGQSNGKTVSEYEKGYQYGVGKAALDKHVENALLKSELYGDPGMLSAIGIIFYCYSETVATKVTLSKLILHFRPLTYLNANWHLSAHFP
jgi:hypothetical protein